jgi:hypothetical protein
MARDEEPIRPMTLGSTRRRGVRGLFATCRHCGHERAVNMDDWPDDAAVPSCGPRRLFFADIYRDGGSYGTSVETNNDLTYNVCFSAPGCLMARAYITVGSSNAARSDQKIAYPW